MSARATRTATEGSRCTRVRRASAASAKRPWEMLRVMPSGSGACERTMSAIYEQGASSRQPFSSRNARTCGFRRPSMCGKLAIASSKQAGRTMHDIVIRGGSIVDGTGAPASQGDVAIDGDRIVQVGGKAGPGRREVKADGRIVTPGWVDVHTHYDGQATWDPGPGAVLLARRHDHRVRQLRRGLRPRPPTAPEGADRSDGGRGGHSRHHAVRRPQMGLGELPRLPRCARAAAAHHRRCGADRPPPLAGLCHGRARHRPRACDGRGYRSHGPADGRGPEGWRHRLHHQPHGPAQDAGRRPGPRPLRRA